MKKDEGEKRGRKGKVRIRREEWNRNKWNKSIRKTYQKAYKRIKVIPELYL